jgi:type VI protein secretion system component Hcp
MLSDNFMWIGDGTQVPGETSDRYFQTLGAFEIVNFTFDMTADDTTEAGSSGASSGKAKFGKFKVEKVMDRASVPLYKACCTATIFPSIMVAVRKAGGDHLIYLQYIFRWNQITLLNWQGGTGAERPKESLEISYKGMGIQYVSQDARGRPQGPQYWAWNTADQGAPSLNIPGIAPPPAYIPPSAGT